MPKSKQPTTSRAGQEQTQSNNRALEGWKSLLKFLSIEEEEKFESFLHSNPIFTYEDIVRLYKRFEALDTNKNGLLDPYEIQSLPALQENPLVPRLVQIFDSDKNGSIDFVEFLTTLSTFSHKGGSEMKLRLLFSIYDRDSDGFLSNEDLYLTLHELTGSEFDDVALQQIVDKTMILICGTSEGLIPFEQYKEFIGKANNDLVERLTTYAFEP